MRRFAIAGILPLVLVLTMTLGTKGGVLQVATGQWAPAANLAPARANSTATLLQDGRVLIAGGDGANGALATAEFFGADGSISVAPAMTVARSRHFAVALQDGRVLVGGGVSSNGMPLFSAEIFDPVLNTWTPAASGMTEARAGAAAGLLPSGLVVVSGGDSGTLPSMTIEVFDPATGTFALAGAMSAPRTKHAMAVLRDGRVMMLGGWNGSSILQSSDIFDPATGQVSAGPQLLAARMNHTATTSLTGAVVIAGGTDGKNDLASVEIFDPAAGTMAAGTSLATARQGQLAVLLPNNNNILYVGGTAAGAPVAAAEMYSPWQATMASAGANAVARSQAAATGTGADGVLLVSGGADANGAALAGNELYGYATVKTDASDYAPGTTVTIKGTGWKPGETVTLTLVESPLVDTHSVMTEVADANGNFVNTDFSPDTHDVNIRFFLTAVGSASGLQAMNTFTDGNVTSLSGTVRSSAAGNPAIVGATITCTSGCTNTPAASTTSGAAGAYVFNNSNTKLTFATNGPVTLMLTATASGFNAETITLLGVNNGDTLSGKDFALTPISATNSTVIASPTSVPADGTTTSTITVTLLDASSQPVAARTITLTPGSGSSTITTVSGTTNASGVATFTVKDATAQAVTYTAKDTPDNITITQTATVTFTATTTATTTAVTSSLNPSVYGNSVTFTAKVAPASGSTAPTGSVQFKIDGVNSGAPVAVTACAPSPDACATLTTAALTAGNHTVEADFTGTGNFTNSTGTLSGGQNVNKATLTAAIIGDPTKPYDGNTNATLASANFSLSGLVGTDSFTVTKTSGTYNSKDVATAATVTATLAAGDFTANGGTLAANYTLPTTVSGAGKITAVTLTASIIGNPTKPYDGNNNATLSPVNFSLSGLVGTESFSVTKTSGTYNSKDVVTATTVTATLAAGDFTPANGAIATNYVLPTTASGGGTITAVTLTASIIGTPTKPYDGNTNATLAAANFSLMGLVGTESITVNQTSGMYNSKDVLAATTVTASLGAGNFTAGAGTLLTNYVLPTTASGAGKITAVTLTASIIGNPTKPYDGNTSATLIAANFSLMGLVGTESIAVNQTSGMYNSKDVLAATTVTASLGAGNFTAGAGTLLTNYVLPTTASGAGKITAVTLTASIIGNPTKPYDGNASATLAAANFSLMGLVGTESMTVNQTSGMYNSKDVLAATTVTASLGAGNFTAGAGTLLTNYVLPTTASGAGQITAITLTASIIGTPTKPYDGNMSAFLSAANFMLNGLVGTESIAVNQTAGTYNSKDVAAATTVTASLGAGNFMAGAGTLLTNYVLPATASGAGKITAVMVTAAIVNDPTKPYDGNTNAALIATNFMLSGLVGTESFTVTKTSGSYNSKDVVTATTVTSSLAAGDFSPANGAIATNYVLPTTASGPGQITAVTLTASIINDPTKPYDGNTNATLIATNFMLNGVVAPDSIAVNQTAGMYNSKDVATAATVTATLGAGNFAAGAGTLLTNYVLPTTASGPGHITAVTLTASIVNDPTKPYDGNTSATLIPANFSLSGLVSPDSFTVTKTSGSYNSKDVATAMTVSATLAAGDFTPNGATLASNYVLPTTATGPGHITAIALTASIIGDPTKFFDGNTNATLIAANFSLSGLVSPDSLAVNQTSGTYNSANATTATSVTASLSAANFAPGAGTLLTNYVLPVSASGPGTITPDASSTSVTSSVNPSIFGQTVSFTATVTNTSTGATPTGSVQIVVDGVNFGSPVAVSGSGNAATAAVNLATLNASGGPHSVAANFVNGDGNFNNSNGALAGGQTVNPAPTSTMVSSSVNPSTFGQSVTFTATVSNTAGGGVSTATPTGSVQFYIDNVAFGMPTPLNGSGSAMSGGTATLTVNGGVAHAVKAVYSNADGNFMGSNGLLAGGQIVNKAATSTAVQSSLNPSIFGQSVTFTATVTNTATGVTPTGTVQFVVDGVNFGAAVGLAGAGNSATATSGATAMLTVAGSPHSIVANYLNLDGNFATSSGNTGQNVTKADTLTTVMTSISPSTLNQSVTFTAKVVDNTPMSIGNPTGSVSFYDGATLLGSGPLSVVGGISQATFTTSALSVGTHNITAQYGGDSNFNMSTSTAITQQVQFNFCLLYDPTRSVKSGATYPIKMYACDANGVDVSTSAMVVHATAVLQLSTVVGAPDDAGNANPDSDFRFDVTLGPTGGYIFNLKTTGLSTGTYMLQFTAGNDPIKHSVAFGVK